MRLESISTHRVIMDSLNPMINASLTDRTKNHGIKFSLLFAISRHKIIYYVLKTGSFKSNDFNEFIVTVDKSLSRYKYFLDNARIHHAKIIDKDIKRKMIYNIPYSPQFNPIEYVNNELKRQIREQNISCEIELRTFLGKFVKSCNRRTYANTQSTKS